MRRITYFKLGGQEFHISKVVGAFLVVIALLMFVGSVSAMIESWDNLKYVSTCLDNADQLDQIKECQEVAKDSVGVYVRVDQDMLTTKQYASVLLGPISAVLFWLMILGVGITFYRSGDLVIPIEETIIDIPPKRPVKKFAPSLKKVKKAVKRKK